MRVVLGVVVRCDRRSNSPSILLHHLHRDVGLGAVVDDGFNGRRTCRGPCIDGRTIDSGNCRNHGGCCTSRNDAIGDRLAVCTEGEIDGAERRCLIAIGEGYDRIVGRVSVGTRMVHIKRTGGCIGGSYKAKGPKHTIAEISRAKRGHCLPTRTAEFDGRCGLVSGRIRDENEQSFCTTGVNGGRAIEGPRIAGRAAECGDSPECDGHCLIPLEKRPCRLFDTALIFNLPWEDQSLKILLEPLSQTT